MKNPHLTLLTFLPLFILSCSTEESQTTAQDTTDTRKTEVMTATKEIKQEEPETTEEIYDETELYHIVSVAEGYNYDSLKSIGLKTADLIDFNFDTLGRYYNQDKKGIVLPDDDEDEIYAGSYYPRRHGDDFISLEMQYAYLDTTLIGNETEVDKVRSDTTRMFVFASMYTNKSSADSLAGLIRKVYPSTKVLPVRIYMGCMH